MNKIIKYLTGLVVLVLVSFSSFYLGINHSSSKSNLNNVVRSTPTDTPRPLDKYTIKQLSNTHFYPGSIKIKNEIYKNDDYTSYLFEFKFNANLDEKTLKITTGQLNVPQEEIKGIVVMFRGYVDQVNYETGEGTKNAADFFAKNGYVTIAPDFLGYGGSQSEANNIFEARFQTYTIAATLINTLEALNESLADLNLANFTSTKAINQFPKFIWAHSNGGQIAITTLEILKKPIPTTLWAPVTVGFPYSVLYYTNESEDKGRLIRSELAKFEQLYDTNNYSSDLFLDNITAPIQLHQGTADDAVPVVWNIKFVNEMLNLNKEIEYFQYPGADHNLKPVWNDVILKDLEFFNSYLESN